MSQPRLGTSMKVVDQLPGPTPPHYQPDYVFHRGENRIFEMNEHLQWVPYRQKALVVGRRASLVLLRHLFPEFDVLTVGQAMTGQIWDLIIVSVCEEAVWNEPNAKAWMGQLSTHLRSGGHIELLA